MIQDQPSFFHQKYAGYTGRTLFDHCTMHAPFKLTSNGGEVAQVSIDAYLRGALYPLFRPAEASPLEPHNRSKIDEADYMEDWYTLAEYERRNTAYLKRYT